MSVHQFIQQFNFSYVDGEDEKVSNAYDIAVNTLFVLHGVRNAFMIQDVDYKNRQVYKKIVNLVLAKPRLVGVQIDQGLVIIKIDNVERTVQLLSLYEKDYSDSVLGQILNYPCHGEFDPTTDQTFYRISLKESSAEIMTNGCKTAKSVEKMRRLAMEMQELLLKLRVNFTIVFERVIID